MNRSSKPPFWRVQCPLHQDKVMGWSDRSTSQAFGLFGYRQFSGDYNNDSWIIPSKGIFYFFFSFWYCNFGRERHKKPQRDEHLITFDWKQLGPSICLWSSKGPAVLRALLVLHFTNKTNALWDGLVAPNYICITWGKCTDVNYAWLHLFMLIARDVKRAGARMGRKWAMGIHCPSHPAG